MGEGLTAKRRAIVAKVCAAQIGQFRAKGTIPEEKAISLAEILAAEDVKKLEQEIRVRSAPGAVVLTFEKVDPAPDVKKEQ